MASKYHGNGEACPLCGVTYGEFRTGLLYQEVFTWFWNSSEDSADWKYKRRGTILGKMFQVKQELWSEHLRCCEGVEGMIVEGVPF